MARTGKISTSTAVTGHCGFASKNMYPKVKKQLLNKVNKITYPTTAVSVLLRNTAEGSSKELKKWKNRNTRTTYKKFQTGTRTNIVWNFFQNLLLFLNFQSQGD